jgi:hypothetical protein
MKTSYRCILLLWIISFFCFSCATTVPQKVSIGEEKGIFIGYKKNVTNRGDGYFVLLSCQEGNWNINKIDISPLRRETPAQEVLFINGKMSYIQPAFEEAALDERFGRFNCPRGYNSEFYRNSKRYSPCNSQFVAPLTTVEGLLGKTVVVALDRQKIADVIKQTGLISAVRTESLNIKERMEAESREKERHKSILCLESVVDRLISHNEGTASCERFCRWTTNCNDEVAKLKNQGFRVVSSNPVNRWVSGGRRFVPPTNSLSSGVFVENGECQCIGTEYFMEIDN